MIIRAFNYLRINSHENINTFKCGLCDKIFSRKNHFIRHEKSHSKEKKFHCEKCGTLFKTNDSLNKHIKGMHADIDFKCVECEKVFSTEYKLKYHKSTEHEKSKGTFICEICGKTFDSSIRHQQHSNKHKYETPSKCATCGIICSTKANLNIHVNFVHLGIRPLQCKKCKKKFGFTNEDKLKAHVEICLGNDTSNQHENYDSMDFEIKEEESSESSPEEDPLLDTEIKNEDWCSEYPN